MALFSDRFWWLHRGIGVVLAVSGFVVTIYAVIQAYDTYIISQLPGGDPIENAILRNLAVQFLLLGGTSVLWGLRGIWFIQESFPAQRRFRRRVRALEGDQDALARACVTVDKRAAPVLSGEPLELLWRATSLNSGIMTTIIAIIIVIFGPCAVLFLYLGYCLATNTLPFGSGYLEPMTSLERVGLVAVCVVVAAMLLFLVVFVIRWLPWERGRPFGIAASNDGLWYYPRGGKRRFLRWEEARLLEVSKKSYRKYQLSGRNTLVWWWEQPPSSLVTLDLTKQEFAERHQALLNLIVARTHLLPCTFDKRLAEDPSSV